ncbi:MAG: hypothetical protein N2483_07545 [Burkholderiaceae bacterium]|nr:hypothetical protein [Burkholderiaceae bacterium]
MTASTLRLTLLAAVAAAASACATITGGSTQTLELVALDTRDRPVPGMVCTLTHGAGTYTVQLPPCAIKIRRCGTELQIECRRGELIARGTVVPRAESAIAHAFLPGGLLATLIDYATGAMYTYPSPVALRIGQHLRFETGAQARATWVASVGQTALATDSPESTTVASAPQAAPPVATAATAAIRSAPSIQPRQRPAAKKDDAEAVPRRIAPLTW